MTAIRDRELLELLEPHPDLLAVADALQQTQPRSKRRHLPHMLAAAAAIAAAVAIALVAPWQGNGPSVVDRALAALGNGPVVHAVVEQSLPYESVVDIATGRERERTRRIEYWYDRDRSKLHTRLSTDGRMLTEIVEGPNGLFSDVGRYPASPGVGAQLDPALAGFVTRYREALATGAATAVGHQRFEGRDVTILRFALSHGAAEEVGVDSRDYRPLFLRYLQQPDPQPQPGAAVSHRPILRVIRIESLPRDESYFAPPKLAPPRPTAQAGDESSELTLEEARQALGGRTLWIGDPAGGAPLTAIELSRSKITLTDGSKTQGVVLRFTYGKMAGGARISRRPKPWVELSEATTQAGAYMIGMEDGGDPVPPEGSMAVTATGEVRGSGGHREEYRIELRRGGVYVELRASSRDLLLEAAKALRRLR